MSCISCIKHAIQIKIIVIIIVIIIIIIINEVLQQDGLATERLKKLDYRTLHLFENILVSLWTKMGLSQHGPGNVSKQQRTATLLDCHL